MVQGELSDGRMHNKGRLGMLLQQGSLFFLFRNEQVVEKHVLLCLVARNYVTASTAMHFPRSSAKGYC